MRLVEPIPPWQQLSRIHVGNSTRLRNKFRAPTESLRLRGLCHKYAYVRCSQFGLWRGAREGVYPQRYSTDRATKPQAKLGATLRAACLLDGGVVARSLQIHVGICSSLAPSPRPKSIAANVCVFMK